VTITPDPVRWTDFSPLLQRGVFCPLGSPCSVADYLTRDLAIEPGYVRERIATVFLDGSVVDDLEAAMLHPGSTLTLSAAMPGLVGATLRRGGFYAAMRSQISWRTEPGSGAAASSGSEAAPGGAHGGPPGTIRLKLFNTVLREIGPAVLRRGVTVERGQATGAVRAWCCEAGDAPDDTTEHTPDDPEARWVSLRVISP
jgi:hypothetical protein